jgi:hypothetical protein
MRSNITLNVEFLAGTDLEQAVVEAKQKAALFDVAYICFSFNGVSFSIGATADVYDVLERWRDGTSSCGICAY